MFVSSSTESSAHLRSLATELRALASVLRLKILAALADGEHNVTDLSQQLRVSQPLLSWHLNELRLAGFVEAERVGREVRYRLNPALFRQLTQDLEALLGLPANATTATISSREVLEE